MVVGKSKDRGEGVNEEIVWLYKVIDTKEMNVKTLQAELDKWSNSITPHEVLKVENGLIVIRFQSALKRQAYFKATAQTMSLGS